MSNGEHVDQNTERREALSAILPNTLIRDIVGAGSGLWFRQNRGVVSPDGWLPEVFGDPSAVIVEELDYEPSHETDAWKRRNPGQVAVFAALRSADGDSYPMSRESMLLGLVSRTKLDLLGRRRAISNAQAQLLSMQDEGLVSERFDAIGLSIHAQPEQRLHLTAQGMAEAIKKDIRPGEQFTHSASPVMARLRQAFRNGT